jgi:hypothetical protein
MKNLKIYFVAFLILVAAVSTSAVFSEDTFQIAEGLNAI